MQNRRRSEYRSRLQLATSRKKRSTTSETSPGLPPPLPLSATGRPSDASNIQTNSEANKVACIERFGKHRLTPGGTDFGSPLHIGDFCSPREGEFPCTPTHGNRKGTKAKDRGDYWNFLRLDGKVRRVASKRRTQSLFGYTQPSARPILCALCTQEPHSDKTNLESCFGCSW